MLVAVLGLFYAGYLRWVHYERVAVRHLPEQVAWAVRVDTEQAVLFEPVRRFLFPPLDAGLMGDSSKGSFERAAGVDLALELRELVLVGGPLPGQWLLVVGGLFRGPVLPSLMSALGCESSGAPTQCQGLYWAQADDGAVLVSSDPEQVRGGLVPSERYRALGFPGQGALGAFARVGRLGTAELTLAGVGVVGDGDIQWRFDVGPAGGMSEAEYAELKAHWQQVLAGLPADLAGERRVLDQATFDPGTTPATLTTSWSRTDYARGARALGAWLGKTLRERRPGRVL